MKPAPALRALAAPAARSVPARPASTSARAADAAPPSTLPGYLQGRLAVSQPQDAAEHEAERNARAVVQDLRPGAVSPAATPGAPTRLFRQLRADARPPAPADTRSRNAPAAVERQVAQRQGRGGEPLPPQLRARFEPRFAADLGAVRIHTDAEAAALCQRMQARAFTVGADIYFAAGAWDAQSDEGIELLVHELTHVLQQGAAPGAGASVATPALQREGFWDWLTGGDAPADPLAAPRQRFADAEAWAGGGPYPAAPRTMIGAAGRGGFDAQYLPAPATGRGTLQITQGVAVAFNDTFVVAGGTVQPHPNLPVTAALTARAAQLQAMPPARRARTLATYQWSPAEQAPWLARAEAIVQSTWSGQHDFFLNQPQWNWIGARIDVDIQLGARAQAATDHMTMRAYKLPTTGNLNDFGIDNQVSQGSAANARDQVMQVGSPTLDPNRFDLLRSQVYFAGGQSTLSTAARQRLDAFVVEFNGATAHVAHQPSRVELIGHTSAAGDELANQTLAQARAAAVQTYLQGNGFANTASRTTLVARGEAEADPRRPHRASDQRVDLVVDGGARQVVMAHEFGHALGLGDEYGTTGPGGTVGTAAGHDAMVRDMTRADGSHLPGAVREHTGGIMSYGNEVRPQHYAVFHHALTEVTGHSPWALGTSVPKWRVQLECGLPGLLNDRPPEPLPRLGSEGPVVV